MLSLCEFGVVPPQNSKSLNQESIISIRFTQHSAFIWPIYTSLNSFNFFLIPSIFLILFSFWIFLHLPRLLLLLFLSDRSDSSRSVASSLVPKETEMGLNEMMNQFLQHRKLLFDQGFLDSQFIQLQMLEDESNPDFVVEVVTVFFEDSERILNDLSLALSQQIVDFKKVDAHVHQLKGSSSSIGAQRVKNACVNFRSFCEVQDVQSCRACLQQVKQEYFIIKENLQKLLMMEQQIVDAGGSIPPPSD